MKKPDGGPAFPRPYFENTNGTEASSPQEGMSLRAWLAAHAPMTVHDAMYITNLPINANPSHPENRAEIMKVLANLRVEFADAMIAELAKGGNE